MHLTRVEGWQHLLNQHLIAAPEKYADHGIRWGQFDCCTFASEWVALATGFDPISDFRGKYSSQDEAIALLKAKGSGTLLRTLTGIFGESVHPSAALRGDLAWRKEENALGIIVCIGARQAGVFLGENGFATLPIKDVDAAFWVGAR